MPLMTGSISHLAIAMALFIITHLAMSGRAIRAALMGALGRWGFMAVYSLVAAVLLGWSIRAYMAAPTVMLFETGAALKHTSLSLMMIAVFFVIGGYTTPNPGVMGMEEMGLRSGARGVLKITRHPVMWGVALWGVSHVLGAGHMSALIFFGGMTVLALAGARHIDARRRAGHGDAWTRYEAETSFWPLGAIIGGRTRVERGEIPWWQIVLTLLAYAAMVWGHAALGLDIFPVNFF